jgi:multiple sugar transport system substrate-binding protein
MLKAKNDLPTHEHLYTDPEALEVSPFLPILRKSMDTAVVRPVTPYYNDVTVAIAKYTHEVITGQASPEEGVANTHRAVQLAVDGQGEI